MVRTQIQLTEEQSRRLKRLAAKHRVSVAEIIRRSVDRTLRSHVLPPDQDELRRRALAAIGCGHSGKRDISEKHDDYLAEIYAE